VLSALLVLFGLYFAWDAYRSSRTGLSNDQWGVRFSRAEAPKSFWITIFIEATLAFVAFALAFYVADH
jgi:hypothetical protein